MSVCKKVLDFKQKTPWCWISIQHASEIATIYTWMPRVQMSLFGFLKRLRTRSWASQRPGSKHYLSSNARQVAGVPRSKAANRMWDLKASRWFVRPGEEMCDRNHPKKTLKYSQCTFVGLKKLSGILWIPQYTSSRRLSSLRYSPCLWMSSDHGPRNDWGSTMSTFWISLSFGASCPSRTLWQKMSTAINPLTDSKSDLPSIKLLYLLSFRTLSISSELSLMYFSSLDCQSSRRTKPNRSYNLFGATSCRRQKCANNTRTLARKALWRILDYFILKWINRTCIVFIRRMSKTRKAWLLLRVNRDDSLRDRVQAECLGMSVKNAKPLNKSHKRFQQPIFWTKHLAVLSPPMDLDVWIQNKAEQTFDFSYYEHQTCHVCRMLSIHLRKLELHIFFVGSF